MFGPPPSIKHLPTPMSSGISCIDQIMSKIILSPAMVFSLLTFYQMLYCNYNNEPEQTQL